MRLIGIDCSANPMNIGVVLGALDGDVHVHRLEAGIKKPWQVVADWIRQPGTRGVLGRD